MIIYLVNNGLSHIAFKNKEDAEEYIEKKRKINFENEDGNGYFEITEAELKN